MRQSNSQPGFRAGTKNGLDGFNLERRLKTNESARDRLNPISATKVDAKLAKQSAALNSELKSALTELKTVKKQYKTMTECTGTPKMEDEESLRRRLLSLSRQAEDNAQHGAPSTDPTTLAKLDVAETVMRQLYKRNIELEKLASGDRKQAHLNGTSANQQLSITLDELRKKVFEQSEVIKNQENTITQLQNNLTDAHKQISSLEAALSRQMNSKLQKNLQECTEDLKREKMECLNLKKDVLSLLKKKNPNMLEDEHVDDDSSEQLLTVEVLTTSLQTEYSNREQEVALWNQRLYVLEQEFLQLYAERKMIEYECERKLT